MQEHKKIAENFLTQAKLDLTIKDILPLKGGVSSNMSHIVLLNNDSLSSFVVRSHPELKGVSKRINLEDEAKILKTLELTNVPVPEVYAFEKNYIIMEYVAATPFYKNKCTKQYIENYAAALAHLHMSGVIVEDVSMSSMQQRIDLKLNESQRPLDTSLQEELIRETITKHASQINSARNVFLHSDMWPGNVLVDDKFNVQAVVDWEEPLVGDPLWDLSICQLEFLWLFGKEASQYLTNCYFEITQYSRLNLRYYDLLVSIRPFGRLPIWHSGLKDIGRSDISLKEMIDKHHSFVGGALK